MPIRLLPVTSSPYLRSHSECSMSLFFFATMIEESCTSMLPPIRRLAGRYYRSAKLSLTRHRHDSCCMTTIRFMARSPKEPSTPWSPVCADSENGSIKSEGCSHHIVLPASSAFITAPHVIRNTLIQARIGFSEGTEVKGYIDGTLEDTRTVNLTGVGAITDIVF